MLLHKNFHSHFTSHSVIIEIFTWCRIFISRKTSYYIIIIKNEKKYYTTSSKKKTEKNYYFYDDTSYTFGAIKICVFCHI